MATSARQIEQCLGAVVLAALLLALAPQGAMTVAAASGPALSVDAQASRAPISAEIYGMNWADPALMQELRLSIDRWGGNAVTRYNWQTNVNNTASDYFYENVPSGLSADQFIDRDRAHGVAPVMTMPLIGWTPKPTSPLGHPYACAFRVSLYGAQQHTDRYDTDCGDGVWANGSQITGNDPADTSVAIDPTWVQGWIQHLIARYGTAANGGVRYYDLDNEPALWSYTHRDVHPLPLTYDELRDRTYQYAAAIKTADGGAQTLGPSDWGWDAYFNSALPTDRAAHGGVDFAAWYLQQMRAYEQAHGVRILDYFDEHFYPQANGVTLSPAGNAATQALRLRSTRALWDPTYTDESWIAQPVNLIPRFRQWIAADYPGTKLGIGEYNWGGLESLNGALTQADVLGIFGRERVDLAALWDPPTATQPGAYAFRIYRNYDGNGSAFGETSIRATSGDQSKLAVYAAQRSADGALTLVVINKTAGDLTSALALSGFAPGPIARIYHYSGANLSAIVRQPDMAVGAAGFTATYPANAITLIVVPPAPLAIAQFAPTHGPVNGGPTITLTGTGFQPGTTVRFSSVVAPNVTVESATTLRCTLPAATVPGTVAVTVTMPGGTTATLPGFVYDLAPDALPGAPRGSPVTGSPPQAPVPRPSDTSGGTTQPSPRPAAR